MVYDFLRKLAGTIPGFGGVAGALNDVLTFCSDMSKMVKDVQSIVHQVVSVAEYVSLKQHHFLNEQQVILICQPIDMMFECSDLSTNTYMYTCDNTLICTACILCVDDFRYLTMILTNWHRIEVRTPYILHFMPHII